MHPIGVGNASRTLAVPPLRQGLSPVYPGALTWETTRLVSIARGCPSTTPQSRVTCSKAKPRPVTPGSTIFNGCLCPRHPHPRPPSPLREPTDPSFSRPGPKDGGSRGWAAACGKRGTTLDSPGGQPFPSGRPSPDPAPPPQPRSARIAPRTPPASRGSLCTARRFRLAPRPRSCYATARGPGAGLPGPRPEGPLHGAGWLARCRDGARQGRAHAPAGPAGGQRVAGLPPGCRARGRAPMRRGRVFLVGVELCGKQSGVWLFCFFTKIFRNPVLASIISGFTKQTKK